MTEQSTIAEYRAFGSAQGRLRSWPLLQDGETLGGKIEGWIEGESLLVFTDGGLGVAGSFGVGAEGEMNLVGVFPGWIHLQDFVELGIRVVEAVEAGQGPCQCLAHEGRIGIHLQAALKNFHSLSWVAGAV